MNTQIEKNGRVEWIDFAKGITMFFVIMGHTVALFGGNLEMFVRGGIYSFHMPLFFILSVLTFKFSVNNDQFVERTKKGFKHLIVPTLVLVLIRMIIEIVRVYPEIDWIPYFANKVNMLIYASGVVVGVGQGVVPALGMMWFLVVLFIGRTMYDALHYNCSQKTIIITAFVCAGIGIAFGKIQWLPFSFDIVLAILPFFLFSDYFKKKCGDKVNVKIVIIAILIWTVTLVICWKSGVGYAELAVRRYPYIITGYITGIAGTLVVAFISQLLCKLKSISVPIKYIGKNSLWLLFVHALDDNYMVLWAVSNNNYINGTLRILIDLALFCIFMIIKTRVSAKMHAWKS